MFQLTREEAIAALKTYLIDGNVTDEEPLFTSIKRLKAMSNAELEEEICLSGVFNQLTDGLDPQVDENDLKVI